MPDPTRPPRPESAARTARKKRQQRGETHSDGVDYDGSQNYKRAKTGFRLSPEDQLRLKLRDKQRGVSKDGTAPTKLATLPGVSGLSFAMRYIDGGRERFIEFVQLAVLERHPEAEMFWAVYADLLPSERQIVSFDDVCACAGIRPSRLMAIVVSTAMELGRDTANLIAALTHSKVVAKMADSAERIDGVHAEIAMKDRHAFLQGLGTLPTPKGAVINVHASANAQAAAAATQEPSVPSFVQTLQQAAQARQALPAPSVSDLFPTRDVEAADAELVPVGDTDDNDNTNDA